jgi:hypothetical protein
MEKMGGRKSIGVASSPCRVTNFTRCGALLYSSNRHEGKESSRWCTHTHIHAESRLVVHSLQCRRTLIRSLTAALKKTKDQKRFSIFLCVCVCGWVSDAGNSRVLKNKTIVEVLFVIICFISIFERNVEAEKLRKCQSPLIVKSPTDVHLKLCRRKSKKMLQLI